MPKVNEIHGVIRGQPQIEFVDRWIAQLAERQHGVVARRQLRAHGIGRDAIDHRIKLGRLHVLYRGVYSVGHRILTTQGRWMAAVIASGAGAVLSHRSAAALWGLWHWVGFEVTAPGARRARPGILLHYAQLPPDEVTSVQGIPVTTVPRTLLDLAAVLPQSRLEGATNQAEIRALRDPLSLADMVERHPNQHGIGKARAVVAALRRGTTVERSELEVRFREFLRSRGLPPAQLNVPIPVNGNWFECDCVWPAERLVVELDGRAVHGTAAAFERDRARDRVLNAAGWRVVRITWRQLHEEPAVVAADMAKMLGSGKKRP
jgi:very-short-patch-repair endonuclease